MGYPIKTSGGAGIPILHNLALNLSANGLQTIIQPLTWAEPEKSFIFIPGWCTNQRFRADTASGTDDWIDSIAVLKHSPTEVRVRLLANDPEAGEVYTIPIIEVPVRKKVWQHEWLQNLPQQSGEGTIVTTITGFTPGPVGGYSENDPVILPWAGNYIDDDGNDWLQEARLSSNIKADGASFDLRYRYFDSGEPFTLWFQVMAL
jgi:hypothetical protein